MITELRAQNFKSWNDTGALQFAPLTGFFGANSSGKSSILQVLLMLKQTTERPSDWNEPLYLGDECDKKTLVNLGSFDNIIHGHREDLMLDVSVSWKRSKPQNSSWLSTEWVSFAAKIEKNFRQSEVERFYYGWKDIWKIVGERENNKFNVSVNAAFYKLASFEEPINANPFRCYGAVNPGNDLDERLEELRVCKDDFEKLFSQIHFLGPLREHPRYDYVWDEHPGDVGQRGENAMSALLLRRVQRDSIDNKILEWLVKLEIIDSYRLVPNLEQKGHYELFVTKHKGGPEVRLMDVGFGVSQVLPVLIACYFAPEGSILILEQPEAHLHPKVQSELADLLIDVVKNRNIQIILESHSENLLLRLMRRIAEGQVPAKDMVLYSCDISDGVSNIEKLEIDEYGNISNWPQEFFGDSTGDIIKKTRAEMKRRKEMK